jgi:hypothetical protein
MNLLNKDDKYIEDPNELGHALVILIEENLDPKIGDLPLVTQTLPKGAVRL